MSDGQLRSIFQQYIPQFHWQSVETWSTGQGVPDCNFCGFAKEGWIEFKFTAAWSVVFRAEQVGWIERRLRAGGNVFIAVRRKHLGGIKKGKPEDQLWLFSGDAARFLIKDSIRIVPTKFLLGNWSGGPGNWDWLEVRKKLLRL
jgi:hypothetical protein